VGQGCSGQARRRRYRSVVRHPAASTSAVAGTAAASTAAERTHSGAASSPGCPHLEEFERCDRAVIDCRTYSWRWTAWGTCLLDGLGHLPDG